jgi:hypothetical protein
MLYAIFGDRFLTKCTRCGKITQKGQAAKAHNDSHARDDVAAFVERHRLRDGDVLVVRGERYTVKMVPTARYTEISTVPDGARSRTRRHFTPRSLEYLGYQIERLSVPWH